MSIPYLPSNGIEGCEFEVRWCARCACDTYDVITEESVQCPILGKAYAGEQPAEWSEAPPVEPVCSAFVENVGQGPVDPHAVQKHQARYDALPRDPATGRPVIA